MAAQTTKDLLLDTGLRLLSVEGLSGVTLGMLARESGLSKSGLFAHFNSKARLQLDLLGRMVVVARKHVVEPALAEPEGLPRLLALVERWLGWSARAGLPGGCPVAAALFELDDLEGEVRAYGVQLEQQWRGMLDALVRRAVELRHLRSETDAAQIVWELCGIYLTHHASARFLRDPAADSRARTALAALVERHATQPQERPVL
ncbi:TetR family transcriptional regulator [Sphingomonas sp. TREG-RG-20F-R18-01]|uniref:TetR/AcrR family transcriptional regulator n=1 Tax=Sphingomonas sp. TREG-RG-20F-R18-01 TaxID=2914982 RepID=UPI001F566169|nr:TetR family transcriptional regulator [Sphingomonas sp. TREG-RG-20F-R18-01]